MGTGLDSEDGLTHDGFFRRSQIPSPQPAIDASTDDNVWVLGVPIDVRYCTVMRMKRMFYSRLARKAKIPDESCIRIIR